MSRQDEWLGEVNEAIKQALFDTEVRAKREGWNEAIEAAIERIQSNMGDAETDGPYGPTWLSVAVDEVRALTKQESD